MRGASGAPIERLPFRLPGAEGETIRADLRVPGGASGPLAVALFCHGFKGFKDWGCWPFFFERVARAGFAPVTFNFSHNGIGDEPDRFTRLDLFRKDTWSKQLEDLRRVIDAVAAGRTPGARLLDPGRIALVGHSRGGAVALLLAADDPRIRAVVALAPIARADRLPPEARERARRDGYYLVPNTRTGELFPVGLEAFEDLDRNRERFSIEGAARRLPCPLLVVHGDADETVPVEEGRALAAAARRDRVELEIVPGGSHTFGVTHPFRGTTPALERVIETTIRFLSERLRT